MATIIASKFSDGALSVVYGNFSGEVIANDYYIDLTVPQMAAGNIIDLGVLPANHTISDAIVIADALGAKFDIGIMSGDVGSTDPARTCGAEVFAATDLINRPTLKTAFTIKPTDRDRSIGAKVTTAGTTAGRLRLRVFMHSADPVQF